MSFQEFLELLLNHKKDRLEMDIVLDNSRYHHAKLLHSFRHRFSILISKITKIYWTLIHPIIMN